MAGRQLGRKAAIRQLDQQAIDRQFDADDILTNCRQYPRDEAPADIIAQIVPGFGAAQNFEIEADRERAIARVLALARPGDIVLLAGKGHENTQEFARTIVPFDDREVAARLLKKK